MTGSVLVWSAMSLAVVVAAVVAYVRHRRNLRW